MNCMTILAVVHKLSDATVPLRVFFGLCLVAVFAAGIYVIRYKKAWFVRDPEVTNDNWASRNLRLWEVVLVWILAMQLLIEMLVRV